MIFKSHWQALRGVSLIEVLIAVGIVSLVCIFIGTTVFQFSESRKVMLSDAKKMYLAEEGYELVRFIRDGDWSNLPTPDGSVHYLDLSGVAPAIVSLPAEVIYGLTRSVTLSEVCRDVSGIIIETCVTPDTDSVKVQVSVSDSNGAVTFEGLLVNFESI